MIQQWLGRKSQKAGSAFKNLISGIKAGILKADLSGLTDLSPSDATAWAADEKRLVGIIARKSFLRWFIIILFLSVLATVGRKANII